MTVHHQSYYELKEQTSDEFARETLLFNLEKVGGNVRACARIMRCAPHTVYLAVKKAHENNLKDASHRPKRDHPRHTSDKTEDTIMRYRKMAGFGKRRLRYILFAKEKLLIPESTIGKVLKRHGCKRTKRRRPLQTRPTRYNWDTLFPFQKLEVDVKEILDKGTLPREVYCHLEKSSLPRYQWTAIDPVTRIRFLSFSYRKDWFCGRVSSSLSSGGYAPSGSLALSISKQMEG